MCTNVVVIDILNLIITSIPIYGSFGTPSVTYGLCQVNLQYIRDAAKVVDMKYYNHTQDRDRSRQYDQEAKQPNSSKTGVTIPADVSCILT